MGQPEPRANLVVRHGVRSAGRLLRPEVGESERLLQIGEFLRLISTAAGSPCL